MIGDVASISGLATRVGVLKIPKFGVGEELLIDGDGASGTGVDRGTERKDSAYHSYQTLDLSVSRQSETCSSEFDGR
jgi:hypothetical protein